MHSLWMQSHQGEVRILIQEAVEVLLESYRMKRRELVQHLDNVSARPESFPNRREDNFDSPAIFSIAENIFFSNEKTF
jgi:hypothetical protein